MVNTESHFMYQYGKKKASRLWWKAILGGFGGGVSIGLAAQASFYVVTPLYSGATSSWEKQWSTIVFGVVFPFALVGIMVTDGELYTGNTAALTSYCLYERTWRSLLMLLKVWTSSLLSNMAGSIFTAWFLPYLAGSFSSDDEYLIYVCEKKMLPGWGSQVLLGFGCNLLVCLAIKMLLLSENFLTKIVCCYLPITTFVFAGFEHVVANFYTLSLGRGYDADYTIGDMILYNWIPVGVGNTTAGVCFAIYTYLMDWQPKKAETDAEKCAVLIVDSEDLKSCGSEASNETQQTA